MEELCRISARHHASTHGGALQKKNQHVPKWWTKHGFEEIPQEADPKLESCRKAPSWRRICKTLLKMITGARD